ncbi:MAG TPA: response regulator [Tepidisphaeraceae bacterium]
MVERSTKCKVLVVEDDPVSCQAMQALLTRWGHEVSSCYTSADAIESLDDRAHQCIILDLMLPGVNGIEVLRAIRERGLPIHVAVVTGAFDPALLRDVRALKPDLFLKKPIELSQLKDWLETVHDHAD